MGEKQGGPGVEMGMGGGGVRKLGMSSLAKWKVV